MTCAHPTCQNYYPHATLTESKGWRFDHETDEAWCHLHADDHRWWVCEKCGHTTQADPDWDGYAIVDGYLLCYQCQKENV